MCSFNARLQRQQHKKVAEKDEKHGLTNEIKEIQWHNRKTTREKEKERKKQTNK